MDENLILSLQITALGMGLVFGAIILLAVMMSMLTRFTADTSSSLPLRGPHSATESDSAESASLTPTPSPRFDYADAPLPKGYDVSATGRGEQKAQAAAIAVAMALAEQKRQTLYDPPTALVSAWQLGMRTRQMYEKGGR